MRWSSRIWGMKVLILETSSEKGCLILADPKRLLAVKALAGGAELSKCLGLEVKKLLSCKPDLVAVGTGPGSYTGIRVGVALAKTLSYGWRIPLIGFCSLKSFAPKVKEPFAVLIDARRGGFYAFIPSASHNAILISPEDPSLQILPHIASPHPEIIQKRLTTAATWHKTEPDPTLLAQLCFNQFLENGTAPIELAYLCCP